VPRLLDVEHNVRISQDIPSHIGDYWIRVMEGGIKKIAVIGVSIFQRDCSVWL